MHPNKFQLQNISLLVKKSEQIEQRTLSHNMGALSSRCLKNLEEAVVPHDLGTFRMTGKASSASEKASVTWEFLYKLWADLLFLRTGGALILICRPLRVDQSLSF
jgi:hypothetical protein